jgi:uncharacterized 2Fe-2S/4Fe-4S cluster protein (DUF4445 family)
VTAERQPSERQPSPGEVVSGLVRRPAVSGRTIFDYADDLALQMPESCQRSGRCHECVVEVVEGAAALGSPTDPEGFLREPYRLACQAEIRDAATTIEFKPLRRRLRILQGEADAAGAPAEVDTAVRRADGAVTYDGEPLDVDRGAALGLAIDIGTTTVVVEILDLEAGTVLAGGALENPQRFGGSDVMNRISYDAKAPGELRRSLVRGLNHEIRSLCRELGIDRRVIYEAVVVGNATMRDIYFGIDVQSIGQRPYKSVVELEHLAGRRDGTALLKRAHEVGLWMHPQGRVYGGPLIASHVGADVAADLAAIDAAGIRETWMLVDVGTNTEVVVGDGSRMLTASCPAGPAFEGGLIKYGMPGADGAIERARIQNGGWELVTIGDVPAEGICGSGLIDVLAELRRHDRMTPLGVFADKAREVTVEPERGITLSREDASNLAQAKAANACGQAILLRHLGKPAGEIQTVYLAGGFASHVDIENAIAIGFLADVQPARVRKLGNASILGARRMLLSRALRRSIEELVRTIEHVELETTPDFFELFVEGCQFKPLAAA